MKVDETSARRVALGTAVSVGDVVPVSTATPLPMQAQVGAVPVDAANPMPVAPQVSSQLNPGQANIGAAALQIAPARAGRKCVIISAVVATGFYIGGSNAVNTGNGFYVPPGAVITLETTSAVWAIIGAGNLQVTVLEVLT